MVKTNINWVSMTDKAILARIGIFIKETRISKKYTQVQLAEITGLNRYTIGQLEKGNSVTLQVFLQVLRALNLFYLLDGFVVPETISPLEAVKLKGKKKERVRHSKLQTTPKNPPKSDW